MPSAYDLLSEPLMAGLSVPGLRRTFEALTPTRNTELRALLIGALVAVTCSCASAIESSRVRGRFETIFDCPHAHVRGERGGYRVEGCGRVAHFACFESNDHGSFASRRDKGFGQALLDDLVDDATIPDDCVMEYTERVDPNPPAGSVSAASAAKPPLRLTASPPPANPTPSAGQATPPWPASPAPLGLPTNGKLESRVLVHGGSLVLQGLPAKFPDHVATTIRSAEAFREWPCTASLLLDDAVVPVKSVVRHSAHEARILIPARALWNVRSARRFTVRVCGSELDVDVGGRQELATFAASFRAGRSTRAPAARER